MSKQAHTTAIFVHRGSSVSSKSIFQQHHAARTSRLVTQFDGVTNSVYSSLAVGSVSGARRQLPALVSVTATDHDVWRVVNLKSTKGTTDQFDSVAVLGAVGSEQAVEWAIGQHGRFLLDSAVVSVAETNAPGLMRYLNSKDLNYVANAPVHPSKLQSLQDVTTIEKTLWDGIELKSHNGQSSMLLLDLVKNDDHGQLFDAIHCDDMPDMLEAMGVEVLGYDSLIVESRMLDKLTQRLSTAMSKATEKGVTVVNSRQSEPFKRNKVTQVMAIFEMSDGQSVSIVFHNPDSTPSKLLPNDVLISWKFLLNSRDVSAAVQPNQGEDVQLPVLATRIMKLVNQNSARFQRTATKKVENLQELEKANGRIETKTMAIAGLDAEIARLQAELDKPVVAVAPEQSGLKWVQDDFEKQKYNLMSENGDKVQSVWKSGSKWAMLTGDTFQTRAEAFAAGMEQALWARNLDNKPQPTPAVEPEPQLSTRDEVFKILTSNYGWKESRISGGIEKEFSGMAAAGEMSNGVRILSANFDSKERWIAVSDNAAPTGGAIIPSTEIDARIGGYTPDGFIITAKAFNDAVEDYVLDERNKLLPEPTLTKTDMGNGESLVEGMAENRDGTFTALTLVESKTFKTRAGAERWLAVRGLNPDGTRMAKPDPAVEPKIRPAYLPKPDGSNAVEYIQEWGEFQFMDEQAAHSYALRLEAGEGGKWRAEQQPGDKWRAHRVTSYDQPTYMQWSDAQESAWRTVKASGIQSLIDFYGNMTLDDIMQAHKTPADFLRDAAKVIASGAAPAAAPTPTLEESPMPATNPNDADLNYIKSVIDGSLKADTPDSIKDLNNQLARISRAQMTSPDSRLEGLLTRAIDISFKAKPSRSATNPDAEYLQSIVDGTADLSVAGDELERIGDNLPPELEALFEEAAEAYAQYAIALEV